MSTSGEQHKAAYRRVIEAIGAGDFDALEQLLAPDVVDHNPLPGQAPGREGFKQWMRSARTSFPDLVGTVEDLIGEGDRVAGWVTWRGTHDGPFAGLAPSGRRVAFAAMHLVRFVDGRIAEWWGVADVHGALVQLGVDQTSSV